MLRHDYFCTKLIYILFASHRKWIDVLYYNTLREWSKISNHSFTWTWGSVTGDVFCGVTRARQPSIKRQWICARSRPGQNPSTTRHWAQTRWPSRPGRPGAVSWKWKQKIVYITLYDFRSSNVLWIKRGSSGFFYLLTQSWVLQYRSTYA